ncbi:TPA: Serine/threonine-protein kinase stk11 [Trebouxia sp. C0004]
MEICPGSSKYLRPVSKEDRLLGKGGYSITVERWYDVESREWVAAKYLPDSEVAEHEAALLEQANESAVPRVIKLRDDLIRSSDSHIMVLELVDGILLHDYVNRRAMEGHKPQTEARMIGTAAPLMETLCQLHYSAGIAHFDIKPENIVLAPPTEHCHVGWDRMRVIDFGVSNLLGVGSKAAPIACTFSYAAPEILLAFQLSNQFHGKIKKVNGAAADMWAAGCTLYRMLTGKFPFQMDETGRFECRWQRFRAGRMGQESWINVVTSAEVNETPVEHPMLSQLSACSTTPEAAVSFFTAILHPKPSARLTSVQALDHPYIKLCVHQMQDHYHPPPLDPPCSWEERLRQDCLESSDGHSRMLRILGTLGKAAGLAGFAVVKSVATAVTGERQHDMSQYFPDYIHPEQHSDLLNPEEGLTAMMEGLNSSVNPQKRSDAGTPGAGLAELPRPLSAQPQAGPLQQGNAAAAAVAVHQEFAAAACCAATGQRPALVAKYQRHRHHKFSARTGRSAPNVDSGIQPVPEAAVAHAAASSSAAAAATEAQGAVTAGHAETQLPIIARSSAETAKTAVSDSTRVTTPSDVCASTAAGRSRLPAASAGGQAEAVSTEQSSLPTAQGTDHGLGDAAGQSGAKSLWQGYAATADSLRLTAVLASGNAGAESTWQVTPGTAAANTTAANTTAANTTAANTTAANTTAASATAAQHSSASAAASVDGAASDSGKSHKIELLPMAAEDCGLTLAQQKLRSHQIELLPEDEEEYSPVPQQLQEVPTHPMPPVDKDSGPAQSQIQSQPEGVQGRAVSSLYNATEKNSDMADVSSQQVSVATAGNLVAGGALSGPFSSFEGSSGPFNVSGERGMDTEDVAHREAGSNAPVLYIEDMPIAR